MAHEKPEEFIKNLIVPDTKHTVVYQAEICYEERQVEKALKAQLDKLGVDNALIPIWNSTLHHIDDLPYDPSEFFPPTFSSMRNKQKDVTVRPLLKSLRSGILPTFKPDNKAIEEASSFMPDLASDFKFTKKEIEATEIPDKRGSLAFKGGESTAL